MTQSKQPTAARAAAAVVLVRETAQGPEVYLVERAPELRFFGGYHALPGGVRGAEDGPDDPGASEPDLAALARCAERELFEETGVVLDAAIAARLAGPGGRNAVREAMLRAEREAAAAAEGLRAPDSPTVGLEPICRICTPPFAPVRYDTVFFLARLPTGESPTILPGELIDGRFFRPAAALAAWRRGEILIVPPVLILLECLLDGDLDRFVGRARARADAYARGELHHVRFTPGVVMAPVRTPTLPPATTTNCYLIGEDRLWILDPATPHGEEQTRLFERIDELADDGRPPAGILVSHHHVDHVGAVAATSRRYGLTVHAHGKTLERLPSGFVEGRELRDGDRILLGRCPDGSPDWELIARHTPGHDLGHLTFRETRYDAVFVGDMVSTISTIVIDPPEGHLRTYLASLERLLEEPMSTLYPAHGPATRDGHRVLRQYLRHRQQRESALIAALSEGNLDLPALVAKVYWDTDARMHPLARRSLIAGLLKLAEDGVAEERDGCWRLVVGDTTQPR
jgi:glyoxylase-like metal-dependent hydrolase (beta-lactamase superfamily II)/8-oxo-dGTP pyrophosphatase MutT (NUDIX family)